MKNALEWIKTNPISVASAAVAFLALLIILYFYLVAAPGFRDATSEELQGPKSKLDQLSNVSVQLPNPDPNAEPDIVNTVVNQKVITDVRSIYQDIGGQGEEILDKTIRKNADPHRGYMLGRGNLWPDADRVQNFDLFVRAASDYKLSFKALFTPGDEGWNMPSMYAAGPPRPIEIQRKLAESAFNFINSIGVTSAGALTEDQARQLYAEQRMELMKLLTTRAQQINLYVTLPPEEDIFAPKEEDLNPATGVRGDEFSDGGIGGIGGLEGGFDTGRTAGETGGPSGYPFQIAPWAFASEPPRPDELWEGQVQLWIIRDIMKAIATTNKVGQTITITNPEGEQVQRPASVMYSPIKRLLELRVVPFYVGLHTPGGVLTGDTAQRDLFSEAGDLRGGFDEFSEGSSFDSGFSQPGALSSGARSTASIYPTPPAELAPLPETEAAPEHFGITPTGRISNSVFDVRHARLTIDIEWAQLPGFIETLRDTNFMTVIQLKVTDLDEYALLREGYVYGGNDVVRAELLIESLWFRRWTTEFMPDEVKKKLLIGEVLADPTEDSF